MDQLGLQLPVGFHAEGLQPLALRQHAVQPLHQRDRLVDAHLYTAEDGRHLIDLLDLLRILGILLLALLHEAIKGFHGAVHLLDPLHKRILIKGNSFCTLVKMILVPETQLQHLLGVQLFQFGVGRRGLPTEESCSSTYLLLGGFTGNSPSTWRAAAVTDAHQKLPY